MTRIWSVAGAFLIAVLALGAGGSRAALAAAPQAGAAGSDHPGQYGQAEIDAGSRVYNAQCSQCHGVNGDTIAGVDLRRGLFRRASSDDDLAQVILKGVPGSGMPPFSLQPAELTGVIAFIRAGFDRTSTVTIGNAARGRAIFEGAGACGTCHRVTGRGPRLAPDLSDIGLARTPAALQRSILEPSSGMLPINRPVRIELKNGQTITGRRLNEDTYTVQLIDSRERLLSIPKSDMRTYVVETTSPMPSYASRLSADEVSDLVAYLLTLKEL
jgi:putative heme-binding domain-containing protein